MHWFLRYTRCSFGGATFHFLQGFFMKKEVLIQLKSFQSVAMLFWSKRVHALWPFVVVFAGRYLLPMGSWLADKANEHLVSYEMSAPNLGRMLVVILVGIFLLLVARTLAERKPDSGWEWVARGLRSLLTGHALPKVVLLAVALSGACAGFGVEGLTSSPA
jgi:small-conductance mechanosensitive channel